MSIAAVRIRQAGLALLALSSVGAVSNAFATGTASGTDITNTASVSYNVNSVVQTPVNSNVSTFKVDRKVDVNVVGGATVTTTPGATGVAVIYTVTNTGNGVDNFTLAGLNEATGDTFDVTAASIKIYRDNGTTPNVFDAGDTQVTAAVALTEDVATKFFIVSDMPLTATNGQTANVRLTATSTSTATAGADNPAAVDVVIRNQSAFALDTYSIQAATLAVVKSAVVISDPVNNTTNPKAIPGAVVEYTITVTNSGAQAAGAVTVNDSIPANTTYVAGSMKLGAATLTDAADADAGTSTGTPVTSVAVNAGTVAASGGTATVKFRVTVN